MSKDFAFLSFESIKIRNNLCPKWCPIEIDWDQWNIQTKVASIYMNHLVNLTFKIGWVNTKLSHIRLCHGVRKIKFSFESLLSICFECFWKYSCFNFFDYYSLDKGKKSCSNCSHQFFLENNLKVTYVNTFKR